MKIFVSWSGDLSEELAAKLRDWLPNVIQRVQPYFTPKDIEKGARWVGEITNELQQSRFGVICVTAENMESSWIMFEAGAISASFDQNKICPILFGMKKEDLRGPLFQFQAVEFNKTEIKALVHSINDEMAADGLSKDTLGIAFEKWWPDLDQDIREVLANFKPKRPAEKSSHQRHAEVIGLLQGILELRREELKHPIREDTFVNLYASADALLSSRSHEIDLLESLSMVVRNAEYIHQRMYSNPQYLDRATRVLERISEAKKATAEKASGDIPY